MAGERYIHEKTGRPYVVRSWGIINATNAQDGQRMVLYSREDKSDGLLFVREEGEFLQKFRPEGSR